MSPNDESPGTTMGYGGFDSVVPTARHDDAWFDPDDLRTAGHGTSSPGLCGTRHIFSAKRAWSLDGASNGYAIILMCIESLEDAEARR
jgi:hypothetical protein